MKKLILALGVIGIMAMSTVVHAHSGRTDRFGGHHNWKSGYGSYHYHNTGWGF